MTRPDDGTFVAYLLEQLAAIPGVQARRMFGGCGLYAGNRFFGIVHQDQVYFRTDARTRQRYLDEGMEPFRPSTRQTLKNYLEVPPHVLDDDEALVEWALLALAAPAAPAAPAEAAEADREPRQRTIPDEALTRKRPGRRNPPGRSDGRLDPGKSRSESQ